MRVFLAIISIFVLIFVPVIIVITFSNFYLKFQNERFQKDIEAQAKHYSDLAKANYELRRFKHDFSHIIKGIVRVGHVCKLGVICFLAGYLGGSARIVILISSLIAKSVGNFFVS